MAKPTNDKKEGALTLEQFRLLANRAGVVISEEEMPKMKDLYEQFYNYSRIIHSIDLGNEPLGLTFHPNWEPTY